MDVWTLGTVVVIAGSFEVGGVPTDPDTLTLTLRPPGGWDVDESGIVHDGPGEYHASVTPDQVGIWRYRWLATGDAAAVDEGEFEIVSIASSVSWPTLEEFKQRLDITDDNTDWDGDLDLTRLSRLLTAAIEQTKMRIGDWDDTTDTPTEAQAQSALELACEYAMKVPDPGRPVTRSIQLLVGSRNRFGTA
jgi:hypothetical protein